ncbi:hypothetical protein LJC55_00275 [Eubacteriales bacterium OttesenSCG-928-N14]|nr:hypothetical protein [Eubacteriales bacterium OttesenSCG-928-N14]
MTKKRMVSAIPYVLIVLLAALTVVAIINAPAMEKKAVAMEESKQATDAFFAQPQIRQFINEEAVAAFEKQPEIPSDALYSIRAPEGFYLRSYSKAWDEKKLQLLYEELKKNKHGKEMDYLYEVVIHAEQDEYAAATHEGTDKTMSFHMDFPALSAMGGINFTLEMGIITLYNGDERTTVESMARSLSHEYGHHYTFFHMWDGEYDIPTSEYKRIRNIQDDRLHVLRTNGEDYMEYHGWYLIEIAAEDYVQLMGSPTTKTVTYHQDIQQSLFKKPKGLYTTMNGEPQENLVIPLAKDVPGLAEYFYSFIDEPVPDYGTVQDPQPIEIKIKRGSRSWDLVGGSRTFVYYELTWNTPYTEEGTVYTLVAYDEDTAQTRIIKTTKAGQKANAFIGTYSARSGNSVWWSWDEVDKGTKQFRVIVQFPDGTIWLSEPMEHTF